MTPTDDFTKFRCDIKLGVCVETHDDCKFGDIDASVVPTEKCSKYYSPNAIHEVRDDTGLAYFTYGREVTSSDLQCKAGIFDSTEKKYARDCTTSQDCTRCGKHTNIRAGVCGDDNVCQYDKVNFDLKDLNGPNNECLRTVISFTFNDVLHKSTQGKQNTLGCEYGPHTSASGHTPLYMSSQIGSCKVLHAGTPEAQDNSVSGSVQFKKYDLSSNTFLAATESESATAYAEVDAFVQKQDYTYNTHPEATPRGEETTLTPGSGACTLASFTEIGTSDLCAKMCWDNLGCTHFTHGTSSKNCKLCVELPAAPTASDIAYKLEYDRWDYDVRFDVKTGQSALFGDQTNINAKYDEVLLCSNQGACDFTTGLCTCEDGYYGDACNRKYEAI